MGENCIIESPNEEFYFPRKFMEKCPFIMNTKFHHRFIIKKKDTLFLCHNNKIVSDLIGIFRNGVIYPDPDPHKRKELSKLILYCAGSNQAWIDAAKQLRIGSMDLVGRYTSICIMKSIKLSKYPYVMAYDKTLSKAREAKTINVFINKIYKDNPTQPISLENIFVDPLPIISDKSFHKPIIVFSHQTGPYYCKTKQILESISIREFDKYCDEIIG